ncbi:MAG: tetratricopeptide repeat protein [Alphaproteobacteria bacterium]|nr:tetratricopeptide repeat protein [Alphaproteobacteria bacterium]
MKLVSSIAMAGALVAAGAVAQPAQAQKPAAIQPAAPQPAPAARRFAISPEARKPLTDLQNAVNNKDETAYPVALAAAQAAAKSSDDKYVLAKLMLQHAEQVNDQAARLAAYQAVLASGGADASEAGLIDHNISILAGNAGNWALVEATLAPMLAADPNDIDNVVNLARAKLQLKKNAEALPLLLRAIQLTEASGKPAPEAWYRNVLAIAYPAHDEAVIARMNAALLKSYPTKDNFRNALAIYRASASMPPNSELDLLRLIRASGTADKNEYLALVSFADQASLHGEVKSAIEEGRRTGALGAADGAQLLAANSAKIAADRASLAGDEAKARAGAGGRLALNTGNAYFGYGDYGKAAELFRLALRKSDVDPALVNLRLGEALAMAGQRADSEAAFREVTGPDSGLAGLWLAWLAMRG